MRVALLIGVSEYNEIPVLPAVERDIVIVEKLLRATSQYQEMLILKGFLEAEETKRAVMDFLKGFNGDSIEEVFFYYSGHGDLIDARLIYPMSNYIVSKPRQTSFEDSELDSLLRELKPEVAVKVVDCCHSGTRYIKGLSDLKEAIDSSALGFKDCYFFFSSRHDQISWIGPGERALSVFTGSFISAVSSQPDGEVRYKQIADSVSDMLSNSNQEPQFAIQGSLRNVFCTVDENIRKVVSEFSAEAKEEHRSEVPISIEDPVERMLAKIQSQAILCITRDEGVKVLAEIRESVQSINQPIELAHFYEQAIIFPDWSDDSDVAGEEAIGKWFKGAGKNFFGWAEESDPSSRPLSAASYMPGYSQRPKVIGFGTSANLDYDRFFLRMQPKFSNLRHWELAVLVLWSPTEAAIFSYGISLEQMSWDRFDQPEMCGGFRGDFRKIA